MTRMLLSRNEFAALSGDELRALRADGVDLVVAEPAAEDTSAPPSPEAVLLERLVAQQADLLATVRRIEDALVAQREPAAAEPATTAWEFREEKARFRTTEPGVAAERDLSED